MISARILDEGEASWREMSWARLAMEVRGRRWERVACWAEIRRSHSRAIAEARWGFEEGIGRGVLVEGFRTGRASRWMMWCPSMYAFLD